MKNKDFNIQSIKASIVMPVYNSQNYLEKTIESVIKQTHHNWELIASDDCSTDSSPQILKNFSEKDHRIKYQRLDTNSGAGIARNTSINIATGDVIAFLDSDDLWDNCFLEKSLYYMEKYNAGIVFSSYRQTCCSPPQHR